MVRALPFLFFFAIGCGGAPFEPAGTCIVQGFGGVFVEDTRDCGCISSEVKRARTMLIEAGVVDESFSFEGANIWLRASSSRLEPGAGSESYPWGRILAPHDNDIELERFGRALLHELIHYVQMKRDHMTEAETGAHPNWKENGWTGDGSLDDKFWWSADPLTSSGACY